MSLSNQSNDAATGRVIMGKGSGPDEMTVGELQGQRNLEAWTRKTDEEYMQRVRERATTAAKEIIAKAMDEAAGIREQARQEGYQQGMEEAQQQAEAAVGQYADTLAGALAAVEQGGRQLWEQHRADMVELVRLAVHKTIGIEMNEQRSEMMAALLDQALETIDSLSRLTIRVSPAEQEIVEALMETARQRHPNLERWTVRAEDSLQPGSMIVESDEGMVDNSTQARWASVEPVFDQLHVAPEQEESE